MGRRPKPGAHQRLHSTHAVDGASAASGRTRGRFPGLAEVLGTIGVGVQGAQRLLITFLVAHVAGRDAVGVVATAVSTALLLSLLSLLWPTTTGGAASKFVAVARGEGDKVQTWAVAAQLARRTVATTLLVDEHPTIPPTKAPPTTAGGALLAPPSSAPAVTPSSANSATGNTPLGLERTSVAPQPIGSCAAQER